VPANQRAADLVSRMSLDEKVLQLVNDAPTKVSVANEEHRRRGRRRGRAVVRAGGVTVAADADRAAARIHPR